MAWSKSRNHPAEFARFSLHPGDGQNQGPHPTGKQHLEYGGLSPAFLPMHGRAFGEIR